MNTISEKFLTMAQQMTLKQCQSWFKTFFKKAIKRNFVMWLDQLSSTQNFKQKKLPNKQEVFNKNQFEGKY